jgi:hypothetical protein
MAKENEAVRGMKGEQGRPHSRLVEAGGGKRQRLCLFKEVGATVAHRRRFVLQ